MKSRSSKVKRCSECGCRIVTHECLACQVRSGALLSAGEIPVGLVIPSPTVVAVKAVVAVKTVPVITVHALPVDAIRVPVSMSHPSIL